MDPEVPRTLGNLEDSEPERRPAGRPGAAKKPLDVFLAEFEERLRDHPGESATSAGAAVQGRADGSWRTPVEGGERGGRRLPRRAPWQRPEAEPRAPEPNAPQERVVAPSTPSPRDIDATEEIQAEEDAATDPGPIPVAEAVAAAPEPQDARPRAPAAEAAAPSRRRNRHRRRHHR